MNAIIKTDAASPSVREIGEPVAKGGWEVENVNGKQWRIVGPGGQWAMKPEGLISADEAKAICLACLSPAPQAPATPPAPVPAVGEVSERAAFEKWAASEWVNGQSVPDNAWKGWLARSALSPPAPSGVVGALRAQIDAEHSKVIGDDGYNYAAGQEYGLRLALIIIDKALAAIEEQASRAESPL